MLEVDQLLLAVCDVATLIEAIFNYPLAPRAGCVSGLVSGTCAHVTTTFPALRVGYESARDLTFGGIFHIDLSRIKADVFGLRLVLCSN